MTITVDIRPEVQAELARQAAAHGRAVEAHAASLLEEAVHVPAERLPRDLLTGEESRSAEATNLMELFEPIRGLLTDEEVDTLFSRNPSTGRPIVLT
jgi:plasmid stability protein